MSLRRCLTVLYLRLTNSRLTNSRLTDLDIKKMKLIKALLLSLGLAAGASALAAEGHYKLDKFPTEKLNDQSALQNGAKLFVNYCLNCHAAQSMRYNRLTDIGLSEDQIRSNLLFTADKVGDPMKTSMTAKDAKEWFGAVPPDLSVIARARSSGAGSGSDWVYTYLRAYYRDSSRATGWNNALYPNVGMPHVLWELQGTRGATISEVKGSKDAAGKAVWTETKVDFAPTGERSEVTAPLAAGGHPEAHTEVTLGKAAGGKNSQAEYDSQIADLTAYITYMSDPSAKSRTKVGAWVLMFLAIFTLIAWQLNRTFWKDIK